MTIYSPKISFEKDKQNSLLGLLAELRGRIRDFYQQNLPANSSSLLLGIVFGINQNLPKDFQTNLQATGLTHVVAASGMNVTMVGAFLLGLFGLLERFLKRQASTFFVIIGLFIYTLLSGLQPSIVRAALMFGSVLLAQSLGRQYNALYVLFLVGVVMLLQNPLLVSSVGFLLSFFSTIGIILFQPILPLPRIISADVRTTLAAQIATVPILLSFFGQYSLVSILTNALLLWTIPPLMVLGGIGALIGLVFEPLGKIFLYPCLPFLLYFEKVVSFFGSLNWALSVSSMPVVMIVGYYLILLGIVLGIKAKDSH